MRGKEREPTELSERIIPELSPWFDNLKEVVKNPQRVNSLPEKEVLGVATSLLRFLTDSNSGLLRNWGEATSWREIKINGENFSIWWRVRRKVNEESDTGKVEFLIPPFFYGILQLSPPQAEKLLSPSVYAWYESPEGEAWREFIRIINNEGFSKAREKKAGFNKRKGANFKSSSNSERTPPGSSLVEMTLPEGEMPFFRLLECLGGGSAKEGLLRLLGQVNDLLSVRV